MQKRINEAMVELWPDSLTEDLNFDEVLNRISSYAKGEEAKKNILASPIYSDINLIRLKLDEIEQFGFILKVQACSIQDYSDIRLVIRNLRIVDYILSVDDLLQIKDVISNVSDITHAICQVQDSTNHLLRKDLSSIESIDILLSRINKIIGKDRTINDSASENLEKIRKKIKSKQSEIYKSFKKIIIQLRNKNVLAEGEESIRNGRLVLRIVAEHRRSVEGIIHDESEGGRTVFIEPRELVELNNDIFDLESEERKEIQKILKELCQYLRPYAEELTIAYTLLVKWDEIIAKSTFSNFIGAHIPQLQSVPNVHLKNACHPLLKIKLVEQKKNIIPCSFFLNEKNRIILISGPNAGGKSIILKTFGLLQLMVQAGLPVTSDKSSVFRIFQQIMGDIGDHQSMDDELSTYSAKLTNMRDFILHTGSESLVLIDEFGSGTEPQIGGAIAEAVLKKLNDKKAFGMINTHYSNLKIFAHQSEGLINGAMVFDEKNLTPTFQLSVGRPGSSYALEIAQKINLPKEILDYAKKKVGKQTVSFENLLSSLDKEMNQLKKDIEHYKLKQTELDKLIQSYTYISKQFEYKKLKLRMEQKQLEIHQKSNKQRELDLFIKELKNSKNLEQLELKAKNQRQELEKEADEFVKLNHQLHQLSSHSAKQEIVAGDTVKLIFSGMIGKVTRIEKGRLYVETDNMTFNMKASELLKIENAIEMNSTKSISSDIERSGASFNTVLDIRGMRLQEAQEKIDIYFDKALLANASRVYIIHGVGNGILKRNLTKTLRSLSFIKSFDHPDEENGGQGTTVIEFK